MDEFKEALAKTRAQKKQIIESAKDQDQKTLEQAQNDSLKGGVQDGRSTKRSRGESTTEG